MNIKPIRTKADYKAALRRVDELMGARPGTPEDDELDILATLVDVYEDKHFPIDPPDPIDAILFRMDQMGLTRKDLEQYIGGSSRVSEVLNRKRGLSLAMIRSLHTHLNIPLDILAREDIRKPATPKRGSPARSAPMFSGRTPKSAAKASVLGRSRSGGHSARARKRSIVSA